MDNATRRELLEKAKQIGYPGDILDVFANPQILDEYVAQQQNQPQQQQQLQPEQQPISTPTPPATVSNYKPAKAAVSEAQPLINSYNSSAPKMVAKFGGKLKEGGVNKTCPENYIWSSTQNKCVPHTSYTEINKTLEDLDNKGWDTKQLASEVFGAILPGSKARTINAGSSIADVIQHKPLGVIGGMAQLIPDKRFQTAGAGVAIFSATPWGNEVNKWLTTPNNNIQINYGDTTPENPRQSLDRFAVSESTKQPAFIPKNTKKKFENGGPKEMPLGLPLKEQNPYLVPEYNQPKANGYILPDPQRPRILPDVNASEYKATYGTNEGDVQVPTIVAGQYIGDKAWDRYKLTSEEFKPMTDPRSYSRFYDQVNELGIMQEPKKFEDGGLTDPPKKRASDEELMFGMRPEVAVQDNTNVVIPRIEEAKRDERAGITPAKKVQATTAKKKMVAEENRQKLVEDLSNQGTISPATEGTERLKNQFIYAMDQPLDAAGSLMQRGYVPQGNLNGDYETASPMSSVIGAFNPASALMDAARVGRDLTEKETYTTLGGAGELGLHTLGVLPSVKLGKQLGKKALAESLYWGIEPIGYGVKEKIAQFPINLVKYGYHGLKGNATNAKLKTMEAMVEDRLSVVDAIKKGEPYKYDLFKKQVRTLFNPKESPYISKPTQARLDAWRTTWNKPQLFDTFSKVDDDKYVLNAARTYMTDRDFNSIMSNIEANKATRAFKKGEISKDEYDKSLKAIHIKLVGGTEFKNKTFKDIEKMMDENPDEFGFAEKYDIQGAKKGGAASAHLKDEGFTDVLSSADEFGVRGGFLYHKKLDADGNIHLRAHDRWDFNPWAKRGVIRNTPNANMQKVEDKNVINALRHIDPIKILGGKPYDIENNYILDPVTHKLIRAYKTGGKKCYTCNGSKMEVLYNKAKYKK